jgi:hypothetical protein
VVFETELADALYVNWAVPREELPPPPPPLTLECVVDGDATLAFVTLVLFRQRGVHLDRMPWIRLEFPQCNLRLPARDADRVASIWLLRQLVPAWVVPLGRVVARQPVSAAILRDRHGPGGAAEQRWEITAGAPLVLTSTPAAATVHGPALGGWESLVAFFRERPRGYLDAADGLRRIEAAFDRAAGIPCRVELERAEWLAARLPGVAAERWGTPHSAFVVPRTRLVLQRARAGASAVVEGVPVPSA